jgi:integrase/recombinase XerC
MHAIEDHLEHLRLLGHSDTTIYGRMTFLRMLGRWLDSREPRTVPGVETAGRGPGLLPLAEQVLHATPADLAAWRASLTVSDEVVVHYVCHAASFYAWAVREGLREDNPAAGLPVPRTGRRLPRPAGELDLMRALALASPRVRPWLVLAGWAGLRAKEIAFLRREAVLDTAAPPVLIIAAGATKGRTERTVPMSGFVLAELGPVLPPAGWVFRRMDGRKGPNSPGLVSHLANQHMHDCGVAATLHQLRHRFASEAYKASRDLRAVQSLMGHARPETTAGYAEFSRPEAAAAVEAIPAPARLRAVSG